MVACICNVLNEGVLNENKNHRSYDILIAQERLCGGPGNEINIKANDIINEYLGKHCQY